VDDVVLTVNFEVWGVPFIVRAGGDHPQEAPVGTTKGLKVGSVLHESRTIPLKLFVGFTVMV
jgi:hypothetical protein